MQSLCLDVRVLNQNNEEIEIRELDDDDLDLPGGRDDFGDEFRGQDKPQFRADAMLEVDAGGEHISDVVELEEAETEDDDFDESSLDLNSALADNFEDLSDDDLFGGLDSSIDLSDDDDLDF